MTEEITPTIVAIPKGTTYFLELVWALSRANFKLQLVIGIQNIAETDVAISKTIISPITDAEHSAPGNWHRM